MSNMEIDRVLAQIRSMSGAAKGGAIAGMGGIGAAGGAAGPNAVGGPDTGFANLLKKGIDGVNATQAKAADMATKFERGVPGVELPQVMLEMQKASVSFRALTEVRNKFVEAYREVMNMPL
jgi:flagellar hook-basal body complex protein FliE